MSYLEDLVKVVIVKRPQDVAKPNTHTLMVINRNRKVIFVPLREFFYDETGQNIQACILPDDSFVLGIFDTYNNVVSLLNNQNISITLTPKEVYFYGKEPVDLGFLYEEDFRRKNSLFYVFK